jgi:hypothetical protein
VALADTPFKKLKPPKQNKQVQNITRFTELICNTMIKHIMAYPANIHFPTGTLLNTLVDKSMPVMAPNGDSSKDNPRLPSENPSLTFIPGMEATQIPNSRLDVAKRNPTANAGLFLTKEAKFLIIICIQRRCELTINRERYVFVFKVCASYCTGL